MNQSPIIAIPCRYDVDDVQGARQYNVQRISYVNAIAQAGGAPFLIPVGLPDDTLRTLFNRADGILLTGGGDIDPALYHHPLHPKTSEIQVDRDHLEITLVQWAVAQKKPLLGICRGIQIMAVAVGGTMVQDIAAELPHAGRHDYHNEPEHPRDYLAHTVTIDSASRLFDILAAEEIMVNSMHHQAIQSLPEPYLTIARASDGIIEAIDLPGHPFFCGVQWHPEELVPEDDHSKKLFAAFVDACRE